MDVLIPETGTAGREWIRDVDTWAITCLVFNSIGDALIWAVDRPKTC